MKIELTEKQKVKVHTDKDLFPVLREVLLQANRTDQNKEHLWVCGLGANHLLMYLELVSLGTMFQSIVEPMDIFSWALQKQVPMIVLVHNHPSEELEPSEADKNLTDRMIQVGNIVNVKVVDHLIISTKDYYSFERMGLMARLRMSKKYLLPFLEEAQIKKEAREIGEKIGRKAGLEEGEKKGLEKGIKKGKKEGIKEGRKEMAKKLKDKGIEIAIISETSGLSIKEIEKL